MADVRVELEVAAGRLPDVCARCGLPATTSKWKTMTWYPPWVNILALFALLPAAIVAMILTKKASVKAPFCDQHKGHWLHRNLLIWGLFIMIALIGIGSLIVVGSQPRPNDAFGIVCFGDLALFIGWLVVVVVVHGTAVRPREITDDDIVLAGVCEEFVQAVEDEERENRRRKKRARRIATEDDDDYDEEPRPRRSQSSTEVEADERPRRKRRRTADEDEE